jgi:hypothetical protein
MKTATEHATAARLSAPTGADDAAEITAAYLAKIKRRKMRHRTDSKRPGSLAAKLAAQRKANDAERELNAARCLAFEIEDEVRDQLQNRRDNHDKTEPRPL